MQYYFLISSHQTKYGPYLGKRDAPCGRARVFDKLLHPKKLSSPSGTGTDGNINNLETSGQNISASTGFHYQPPNSTTLLAASLRSPETGRLVFYF